VNLAAGSVYTVLVLDSSSGGVTVRTVLDAASPGVVPAGGMETGAGGTAGGSTPLVPLVLAGLATAGLLLTVLPRPGRRRSARHGAS
jgi:hypothetical protein